MGTLLLNQIKKQASSFLQEKYKIARLAFTDVTPIEMLAEEATNNDLGGPDARTMTQIAEASFDIDDYWRVVDVLHRRLDAIDWKQWRQSYKSLVLLEFLLTHGPLEFAEEFLCDYDIIQELGTFKHIDEKGFNWGANMQKRSDQIINLLEDGEALEEARSKALKITKEIQGFGSSSPSSSWSPSSNASGASSWGSFSTSGSTYNNDVNELNKLEHQPLAKEAFVNYSQGGMQATEDDLEQEMPHVWVSPAATAESGSLLDPDEVDKVNGDDNQTGDLISEFCSKLVGISPNSKKINGGKVAFRSLSDVGRATKKRLDRQYTTGY